MYAALYYTQSVEAESQWRTFRGYIVHDEELSGFWECGGIEGRSFTDVGHSNVIRRYANYKANIREPVYIEFSGRIAGEGGRGWGLAGEPWSSNVEIREVIDMRRQMPIGCGSLAYGEKVQRASDQP